MDQRMRDDGWCMHALFSIFLLAGAGVLGWAVQSQHTRDTCPRPVSSLSGSSAPQVLALPMLPEKASEARAQARTESIAHKQPRLTVTWGPARNMSSNPFGANEPSAAVHPTNPLLILSSGNSHNGTSYMPQINNSSDGGNTWQQRFAPQSGDSGDAVVTWLTNPNSNSALFADRTLSPGFLRLARTTDGGVTWADFPSNVHVPSGIDDRDYLWTDLSSASPYYGRVYVTETAYEPFGESPGSHWSSDGGANWSDFVNWADPGEYDRGENHNDFPSMAIEPDGTVVGAWHRGRCCGGNPQINVPNKVMWNRSNDGGTNFPISGTIATIPISNSVTFASHSPSGFVWTDAPNIAADPVDGSLYAVWIAYRTPDQPASAAVYLSRGTPQASSWTLPTLVYDNPDPNLFQYMPWVQVSREHTVHVSFGASVLESSTLAEFYVQSTDRGQTFSEPFMLSDAPFPAATSMGDYQASSVGGYTGDNGSILVTWTENHNGRDQWGRMGTFSLNPEFTPTIAATPTAILPTGTPTATTTVLAAATSPPTGTATITPAACSAQFTDVPPGSTFYSYVHCLACQGVVGGYQDGTFRPGNNVTRGQLSKIVSNAAAFSDPVPGTRQTYTDVPSSVTFWLWIERLTLHQVMSGYSCGGPNEPCDSQQRAYFRPFDNATRGQITKIVSNAAGFGEDLPTQTFEDVPPDHIFHVWVERLVTRGILQGYACGGEGELCVPPLNRPYFRPGSNATRGQSSKVVSNTFFANCNPPVR